MFSMNFLKLPSATLQEMDKNKHQLSIDFSLEQGHVFALLIVILFPVHWLWSCLIIFPWW